MAPNGKQYDIPDDKLSQAIQAGGKLVEKDKSMQQAMQGSIGDAIKGLFGQTAQVGAKSLEGITDPFNKAVEQARLPSIAGGALQSAGDVGASLANIPAAAQESVTGEPSSMRVPHPDLSQYLPKDPTSALAFLGGEAGGGLALGGGGFAGMGGMGIPAKIAGGALMGAAAGETDDMGGGRGLGAVIGAGGSAAGAGLQRLAGALSNKKLAKELVDAESKASKHYNSRYGHIFDQVENRNIPDMLNKKPPINVRLLHEAPEAEKYLASTKEFYSKPTLKNAHNAQSDLYKMINSIKRIEPEKRTMQMNEAMKEAERLRGDLNNNILSHLHENNSLDLALDYGTVGEGYRKDVVPYQSLKHLKDHKKNKKTADTFIKDALKNEEFLLNMGDRHPNLSTRYQIDKALKSPLAPYIVGGGVGGTAYGVLNKLLG